MEVEEVKSRDTGDALAGSGMGTGQEGQEGNDDEVDWYVLLSLEQAAESPCCSP